MPRSFEGSHAKVNNRYHTTTGLRQTSAGSPPRALRVEHGDKVDAGEAGTFADCGSGGQPGLRVLALDGHRLHTCPRAVGIPSKSAARYLFHDVHPRASFAVAIVEGGMEGVKPSDRSLFERWKHGPTAFRCSEAMAQVLLDAQRACGEVTG